MPGFGPMAGIMATQMPKMGGMQPAPWAGRGTYGTPPVNFQGGQPASPWQGGMRPQGMGVGTMRPQMGMGGMRAAALMGRFR